MLHSINQIHSPEGHRTLFIPSTVNGQVVKYYSLCMSPNGNHLGVSKIEQLPPQTEEVCLPIDEVQVLLSHCDLLFLELEGLQ